MQELRPLTSLRGIAALWVFFFHLFALGPQGAVARIGGRILERGYLAVDVFFVLSGFVMALTYRSLFLDRPIRRAYPTFLTRRIARVLPLNIVIVLAIALLIAILPHAPGTSFALAEDPGAVMANLLLVQDWGLYPSINKPAWSVSVEMAVYLTFPLLLTLAWGRAWIVPTLASVAGIVVLTGIGQGQVSRGFLAGDFLGLVGGDFVRGFAGFYLGLLCYRAYGSTAIRERMARASVGIVVAFIVLLALSPTDLGPLILVPFLVLALAANQGALCRVLSAPPLHYLGAISYSIYLTHYCVMGVMTVVPLQSATLKNGLTIAATLVLSVATYHLIEQPARRWLRRIAG